ncbi:toxin-antitoxin system YwqK family antitoxin [Pseudomonadota bacterium]
MPDRETRVLKDESGRKVGEAEYVDGKPHGISRIWTVEGVLSLEAEMENGEYHGEYRSWWDNGNKKEEGKFYRGKKVGLYRWYSQDGSLLQEEDLGPSVE